MGGDCFIISSGGTYIYIEEESEFSLTLIPTTEKYIQYGKAYVNDMIVEEDFPCFIFYSDGSVTYYGDGGREENMPAGTVIYKDRYF